MMELLAIIIPPLITALLTYFVANKRTRLQQAKLTTDMQIRAIEAIKSAESDMRKEIWAELDDCKKNHNKHIEEENRIKKELEHANELLDALREEIIILKNRNEELENK